jgi:hypothetical protein
LAWSLPHETHGAHLTHTARRLTQVLDVWQSEADDSTMQQIGSEATRISVSLTPQERRDLVTAAARRSLEEGRPVSVSEVVRESIRRDLQKGAA